jgi:hypothetical protein
MDPVLGRKVLDHVTAHREQFDMSEWGYNDPECGTKACLAGWTLLLNGYTIDGNDDFRDSAGELAYHLPEVAHELLKLTDAERWGTDEDVHGLFTERDDDDGDTAIARFRALVEAAEMAQP